MYQLIYRLAYFVWVFHWKVLLFKKFHLMLVSGWRIMFNNDYNCERTKGSKLVYFYWGELGWQILKRWWMQL